MRAVLLSLLLGLSACAGLTEQAAYSVSQGSGESPDFGVSALVGPLTPTHAAFNSTGEQVADFHARQICTLGYERLEERTLRFDAGQLAWWRVRCAPYYLTVF